MRLGNGCASKRLQAALDGGSPWFQEGRCAVRTTEWVPRRSRSAGQSKKVRSVPGLPAPSA
jgi:hypothetical protein